MDQEGIQKRVKKQIPPNTLVFTRSLPPHKPPFSLCLVSKSYVRLWIQEAAPRTPIANLVGKTVKSQILPNTLVI